MKKLLIALSVAILAACSPAPTVDLIPVEAPTQVHFTGTRCFLPEAIKFFDAAAPGARMIFVVKGDKVIDAGCWIEVGDRDFVYFNKDRFGSI